MVRPIREKESEIYSNTITYDANGNMTSLLDKKISRIGYNTLNLPNQVQSAAEGLSYIYRADGVKVSQQRTISNGFIRKDYIDGFHHETKEETMHIGNPVEPQEPILVGDSFETKPTPTPPSSGTQTSVTQRLLFFPTAEGYYDYLHKRYVYHYTDHLGNVRLSYYKGSNNLVIDKESNYYPFGLEHTGYNGLLGNQSYNYKYNGKELQTEIGMYDYGARFYMPDLGRWGVVDPLAEETMELYSYVKNNPIMLIDPTGMEAEDPEDPPKKSKYIGQIYKDDTGIFIGGKDGSWNATRNDGSKETIIPEVNLAAKSESSQNEQAARLRLSQAIANSPAARSVESFENNLFYGGGITVATAGAGGFALSGGMGTRAIAGRFLADAGIQFGANFTTNGLNVEKALRDVNFTQSILAGGGMNYIGNALISNSVILSKGRKSTVLDGGIKGREFATQTVFGMLGGAVASRISNSSSFKGFVLGTYMQTTSRFGQTAGTVAAGIVINSPDYGTSVIQNKIP
ncbi:RHS repeat-associated core domain-containing protein [Riemerella anatipestifer]|uniref:RHS repeat-associated core domain-containing protein n=1 Tax=Riemerella anatipestifer TaxID=34085 RepID=UPI003BFA76ED